MACHPAPASGARASDRAPRTYGGGYPPAAPADGRGGPGPPATPPRGHRTIPRGLLRSRCFGPPRERLCARRLVAGRPVLPRPRAWVGARPGSAARPAAAARRGRPPSARRTHRPAPGAPAASADPPFGRPGTVRACCGGHGRPRSRPPGRVRSDATHVGRRSRRPAGPRLGSSSARWPAPTACSALDGLGGRPGPGRARGRPRGLAAAAAASGASTSTAVGPHRLSGRPPGATGSASTASASTGSGVASAPVDRPGEPLPPITAAARRVRPPALRYALAAAATRVDRLHVHDHAAAVAVLAGLAERLEQARADPLAGHLHQAERGDLGDLVLGAVAAEALQQPAQHQVAVATPAPCR